MQESQLRNVTATLARDGDLFTLTVEDEDGVATFETSHVLMRGMAISLQLNAARKAMIGADVNIKFPDAKILTLPADQAKIMAMYVRNELAALTDPYHQLANPRWN